ncbi:MAG: trypsin-like serine peptidase [Panacagrimonas sp.]
MSRIAWLLLPLLAATADVSLAAPLTARDLDSVPLHVVATDELARVRAALPPQRKPGPARLAVNVPMNLGIQDGIWSEQAGTAIWRARLYSPGATVLIPVFDRFHLPAGAELRVSDPSGSVVQGPYTGADTAPDGSLWTAMIPGDEALLELRVPGASRDGVDMHLSQLGHGVLSMSRDGGVPAKSGGCNVDVVCSDGDAWRNQIRSVVLLVIPTPTDDEPNSAITCTGQLINNTAQNDRPFVLTANHCEITAANAPNIVAYFGFQTSTCNSTPDGGRFVRNQRGASFRFANTSSDHALIELNQFPGSFGVYLSGFDAGVSAIPQSGVAIHHPDGDEKRISTLGSASRVNNTAVGDFRVDGFRVFWSRGVTEPGSSGGGLWNENQQLVGVLSGGNSSCATPDESDVFGRLHVAWDAGLKSFLDPGDTGTRAFCGSNPGTDCVPASNSGNGGNPGNGGTSDGGGGGAFGAGLLLLLAGLGRRVRRARR